MECAAGHEAQFDFGTGAAVVGADGKRRRTHVLRVVLGGMEKKPGRAPCDARPGKHVGKDLEATLGAALGQPRARLPLRSSSPSVPVTRARTEPRPAGSISGTALGTVSSDETP